jgi:hypothetical protein
MIYDSSSHNRWHIMPVPAPAQNMTRAAATLQLVSETLLQPLAAAAAVSAADLWQKQLQCCFGHHPSSSGSSSNCSLQRHVLHLSWQLELLQQQWRDRWLQLQKQLRVCLLA